MSWSPSGRNFRSPGSSPETYRRIIRTEEDFPNNKSKDPDSDEFFNSSGRRSPTFPRRIFKEVWNETSPSSNRFADRPRMFKRVFKPSHWEDEVPNLRRAEFERNFDDATRRKFDEEFDRPPSRRFDEDFDRRFNLQNDDQFEKSEGGKVHHIPIMVERRMEEMKSRFGKNMDQTPSSDKINEDEYPDDWSGPQVHRLRKTFEPATEDGRRVPRGEARSRFNSSIPETWDPHAVHTLPTRKAHKSSQSFDDSSRHPVPPKYVFRSCSETHEDMAKPQQQPHSAAFRSHSDGHCPNQTYVTKIDVNKGSPQSTDTKYQEPQRTESSMSDRTCQDEPKQRNRVSPALQQIAAVLQNVEDLVVRVEGYSGVGRDKQYRFLDEMLTRCMLRLDDVDTEGREDIRNARKAAVREVQSCIDRLEARANESEQKSKEQQTQQQEEDTPPKVIPLPEAIPLPEVVPHAIPLGDVPQAIPLGSGAIPLGYVPNPAVEDCKQSSSNSSSEQTKL